MGLLDRLDGPWLRVPLDPLPDRPALKGAFLFVMAAATFVAAAVNHTFALVWAGLALAAVGALCVATGIARNRRLDREARQEDDRP
jgi:drug/metabolite transporter (DMT)-like permease